MSVSSAHTARESSEHRVGAVPALLRHVVVATDFTEFGRMAVERAAQLPLHDDAELELVHVAADPRRAAAARRALAALRVWAPGERVCQVRRSILVGPAATTLARHALAETTGLVILGRHGEHRLRDRLLGSTADRVIHDGAASVLVVVSWPRQPYGRPLVAVDLSASSMLALELAACVCGPSVVIDALHVMPTPSRVTPGGNPFAASPAAALDELEQDAREALAEFLASVDVAARWNPILEIGEPDTQILEVARRRRSDLVVLGTRGHSSLGRMLLGSVATSVLHHADSDVLVARLSDGA